MSWSVSTRVHPASKIRSAVEHAQPTADMSEAQAEQMRLAKQAAIRMLNEGIVGALGAKQVDDGEVSPSELAFRVQLHGHVGLLGEGALPSTTIVLEQMPADLAQDYEANADGGSVREVGDGEPDQAPED